MNIKVICANTSVPVFHTVDHLWSHPVGVSHHGVPFSAVGPLQARQFSLRQLLFMLIINHESSQAKVCHHHSVVLKSLNVLKLLLWHIKHTWMCCNHIIAFACSFDCLLVKYLMITWKPANNMHSFKYCWIITFLMFLRRSFRLSAQVNCTFLPLGPDSCVSLSPGGLCSWNGDKSKNKQVNKKHKT